MWRSFASLAGLIAFSALAQDGNVEPIGIVSQLKGTWTRVRDQKILANGDEIFPNNTVRSDPSTNNLIRIALFDGSSWSRFCTPQDPCDGGSYRISVAPAPERSLPGFLSTYFSARKLVPIIFTASRGVGLTGPQEAVLAYGNGAIDLNPSLRDLPAGKWRVTLSDPSKTRESGVTETVDWPQERMLRGGALTPGVYALDVQGETGEPLGPPAAVLLTPPDRAAVARGEFDQARTLAFGWSGIDTATVRAFLVQALYAIQLGTRQ
jgi:hypothetical protein